MKIKILLYSVARSDLDRFIPLLNYLKKTQSIEFLVIASYIHYLPKFGNTHKFLKDYNLIKRRINLNFIDNPKFISEQVANEIRFISKTITKVRPNVILVLGDRYEMIAAPIAALPFKIPIVHFYGGAVTYGAIDELVRHSISKMSHLHFTAHKNYSNRLIKMGEEKWRVHTVGIISLKNLKKQKILSNTKIEKSFNLDLKLKTLLVTIHPTTLNDLNLKNDIQNVLKAIKKTNMQAIFTYPNSDHGHETIIKLISVFCKNSKKYIFLKNLSAYLYPSILKKCFAMVGNSSSGIVEAASFKMPVINIGTRQDGKIHGKNVVNSDYSYRSITRAFEKISSKSFLKSISNIKNLYEPNMTPKEIFNLIEKLIKKPNLLKKKFVD
ncbi:MAG: UDP-N-acetylglucosamine 2-epimerase (hydrolyzing) [Pelagibacterales bacterium MED-G44]|nr:MAG: UDP-N-acetylglucosamine 2-epimerase (hydrolyzing) [Pelagibacterales bacterium MED-G44]